MEVALRDSSDAGEELGSLGRRGVGNETNEHGVAAVRRLSPGLPSDPRQERQNEEYPNPPPNGSRL